MSTFSEKENLTIIEALLLKVGALENDITKLSGRLERFEVNEYMYSQFIYKNQAKLLTDFSEFVFDQADYCAHHYGISSVDKHVIYKHVIYMLEDISSDFENEKVVAVINKLKDKSQ